MSCFWFGHAPPATSADLTDAIKGDGFTCRRCGKLAKWIDQPKAVRVAVIRARTRLAAPASDAP